MIRKLKIKFITIATLAISLVLIVLVGGINVYNYVSVVGGADRTLALIENGGGEFPQFRPNGETGGNNGEMPLPEQKPDEKPSVKPDGISPEAPFETRYFSVRIDDLVTLCRTDEGSAKPITLDFSLSEAAAATAKPSEAIARTKKRAIRRLSV